MAILKLKNGLILATAPVAFVIDDTKSDKKFGRPQEIYFQVHPRDVDNHIDWKGGEHGDNFDVVEVLKGEEAERYYNN